MAKKQPIQVGQILFQTKGELKNYTKSILNNYELNTPINYADLMFISELLKRHPECDRKKGSGIMSIVIKSDGNWGKTRCFHIQRTDGTETDFSYLNCIDNDTTREPMKMFRASARSAIESQIVSHLATFISKTKDINNCIVCEKSLIKIPKEEGNVDHMPPTTFDKIIIDFLELTKIDPSLVDYIGFGDNEYTKEFKDVDLQNQFAEYHREVARLRVISKQENLRQKKKNFD